MMKKTRPKHLPDELSSIIEKLKSKRALFPPVETRKKKKKMRQGRTFESESFNVQNKTIWPGRGRHILAQYDHDSIVVYQAFCPQIVEYALQHKKFVGCPLYNHDRMTWIKTNFMWMMFRCGWCKKKNQERVIAIWLKRDRFELYLEHARERGPGPREEDEENFFKGKVRLQWDPDHVVNGDPHPYRKAVQLGLKKVVSFANGEDWLHCEDVTPFVVEQRKNAEYGNENLMVAKERVYKPMSKVAIEALKIDKEKE